MDEKIIHFVNQVKSYLIKNYGEKIKEVILYGSYVREEATKDSDINILVLIDDSLNPFEVRRSLSDLLFDILLENGELISVVVLPERFFNYNYPFMLNVKKEGVRCMKEIRDFMEKAEKFLSTAEHALNIGDYDSCVSRCYYAMFFMAEAIL